MSDHGEGEGCPWAGFDWTRERYEDMIRRVVPGYREQEPLIVEVLREAAPGGGGGPFRILELGAGTGTLSRLVLETFPGAELIAMDVSPVMLGECAGVLAPFGTRARLMEADFATADLGSGYHAVVSRLAIHHLSDGEKRSLFGRVAEALQPGGVFVSSDLIAGETEAETEAMLAEWREHMVSQGDDPAEWTQWLVGEADLPSPARSQVEWLLQAGFDEARTIWRRANFAILRAVKAG
ncbi:MAG: class I SAM-dependent methyltransferase [bacterium]